jgi:hypothetical protein
VLLTGSVLTANVALAQPSKEILKDFLDENVLIVVPVATNRVTTISFPSAITAIDGAGVTVDGKTPGLFQLAHTKGSAFLSVRALFPKAAANLNIRWNDQTYVFELTESDQPVLSLNMEARRRRRRKASAMRPKSVRQNFWRCSTRPRRFRCSKRSSPKVSPTWTSPPTTASRSSAISTTTKSRSKKHFRFNAEDTLVFRLVITNKIDAPLIYQPDSFALRAGNRLYPNPSATPTAPCRPKAKASFISPSPARRTAGATNCLCATPSRFW